MQMRNDGFIIDPQKSKGKPLEGLQLNAMMRNVYGWMTMGLLVTAAIALGGSNSGMIPNQMVVMLAVFAQLGIVFGWHAFLRLLGADGAYFFDHLCGIHAGVNRGGIPQHSRRLRGDDHRRLDDQCRSEQI